MWTFVYSSSPHTSLTLATRDTCGAAVRADAGRGGHADGAAAGGVGGVQLHGPRQAALRHRGLLRAGVRGRSSHRAPGLASLPRPLQVTVTNSGV